MRFPPFLVAKPEDNSAPRVPDHQATDSISEGEKSAPCAFESAALPLPIVAVAPIERAIEACRRAHNKGGALSEWGTAAAPTLAACLEVLVVADGDLEAEARFYAEVVALKLPGKAPVRGKTALSAVFLCRQPGSPKARKECSRFACLVVAARQAGTQPEQAADYLSTTTLSAALLVTRKGGEGAHRVLNPIRKARHPTLWAALAGGDKGARVQAEKLVAVALERAEAWLREQVANGAPHDAT